MAGDIECREMSDGGRCRMAKGEMAGGGGKRLRLGVLAEGVADGRRPHGECHAKTGTPSVWVAWQPHGSHTGQPQATVERAGQGGRLRPASPGSRGQRVRDRGADRGAEAACQLR